MAATSLSLLDRLKGHPRGGDWERLHALYLPLVRGWLGRIPGLHDEAADLAQEVMLVLVRELPGFDRRRVGSFRAWLREVTANRVRGYLRDRAKRPRTGLADPAAEAFVEQLHDPASGLSARWDREHDRHVFDRLLEAVRPDFHEATWSAFRRFALDGTPAARVAEELGTTENAVLLAKARVLKRLREEAGGLID